MGLSIAQGKLTAKPAQHPPSWGVHVPGSGWTIFYGITIRKLQRRPARVDMNVGIGPLDGKG